MLRRTRLVGWTLGVLLVLLTISYGNAEVLIIETTDGPVVQMDLLDLEEFVRIDIEREAAVKRNIADEKTIRSLHDSINNTLLIIDGKNREIRLAKIRTVIYVVGAGAVGYLIGSIIP